MESCTNSIAYIKPGRSDGMNGKVSVEGTLDIEKVFKAIAEIIGDRENVDITVVSVKKKTGEEDKPA